MSNFVTVNQIRIHKSTIKKYSPNGETKINLYYSPSRNKMDVETFVFEDEEERNIVLQYLDTQL